MISDNRMKHIIGVARQCYNISKQMSESEDFCRKMFMLGYLHDVGYEFAENKDEHPSISADLAKLIGVSDDAFINAIRLHGELAENETMWLILNKADMTVDSKGNVVTAEERLKDIANRYGQNSDVYDKAYTLCKKIGLIYD